MVLDHLARVAFTSRCNRADPVALERFATHFNHEPRVFNAAEAQGQPICHTNMLMCIATRFALVANFAGNASSCRRRRAVCRRWRCRPSN